MNTVYCPNKFNYLKVDVEKRLLYNCHKAYPERVTTTWLKDNPGKIFNTEEMITHRTQMLNGERNRACSYQCYPLEDKGAYSHRMSVLQKKKDIYNNPVSYVETLDVVLSSDCNLSCVYCSGMFSSAWRREIKKFGEYENIPKNYNDVLDKVSQKQKMKMPFMELFLKEIEKMNRLKKILITGGEPLLHNHLDELLTKIDSGVSVHIFTGLGVSLSRFKNLVERFQGKNIVVNISAEGLGEHLEFARHGSSAERFELYIEMLRQANIEYQFTCTVNNLTIFGLQDFYSKFNSEIDLNYNPLSYPNFLQKHIIDPASKTKIMDFWMKRNDRFSQLVLSGMDHVPSAADKKKLQIFLKQIKERRQVTLDHFPKTFLDWLEI